MTAIKALLIACGLLFFATALSANNENTGNGDVAEVFESGGYQYIRLKQDNTWLAANPTTLAVGDHIQYSGGAMMENFHSSSLNRTFKSILFVMKVEVFTPVNADVHASAAGANPHFGAHDTNVKAPGQGEIAPLDGGKTVAEIHSGADQLNGQQVALHARVMKFNEHILGKNWVTLKDGTGSAPDNQLIVTTQEKVTVGTLVTAHGVVRTNVDIGTGYKYSVLLEDTSFTE